MRERKWWLDKNALAEMQAGGAPPEEGAEELAEAADDVDVVDATGDVVAEASDEVVAEAVEDVAAEGAEAVESTEDAIDETIDEAEKAATE